MASWVASSPASDGAPLAVRSSWPHACRRHHSSRRRWPPDRSRPPRRQSSFAPPAFRRRCNRRCSRMRLRRRSNRSPPPSSAPGWLTARRATPPVRELTISRSADHAKVEGRLDLVDAEIVDVALSTMVEALDLPNEMPYAQRRARALVGLASHYLERQDQVTGRLGRPHVVVLVDLEVLEARSGGSAALASGAVISGDQARRLAEDANISRVVTKGRSEPLTWGEAPGASRRRSPRRSSLAIVIAATEAAPLLRGRATFIIENRGPEEGRPRSTTWACSAGTTTSTCTDAGHSTSGRRLMVAGRWRSVPMSTPTRPECRAMRSSMARLQSAGRGAAGAWRWRGGQPLTSMVVDMRTVASCALVATMSSVHLPS